MPVVVAEGGGGDLAASRQLALFLRARRAGSLAEGVTVRLVFRPLLQWSLSGRLGEGYLVETGMEGNEGGTEPTTYDEYVFDWSVRVDEGQIFGSSMTFHGFFFARPKLYKGLE